MSDTIRHGYDTSIGTEERSARSATKFYGLILAVVFTARWGRQMTAPFRAEQIRAAGLRVPEAQI
jgi:hypothetical protein